MKVKIIVTQADINASRGSVQFCPIERATHKLIKPQFYAFVGVFSLTIRRRKNYELAITFPHIKKVKAFLVTHDKDFRRARPFSFILNIPDEYLKASVLKAG